MQIIASVRQKDKQIEGGEGQREGKEENRKMQTNLQQMHQYEQGVDVPTATGLTYQSG